MKDSPRKSPELKEEKPVPVRKLVTEYMGRGMLAQDDGKAILKMEEQDARQLLALKIQKYFQDQRGKIKNERFEGDKEDVEGLS